MKRHAKLFLAITAPIVIVLFCLIIAGYRYGLAPDSVSNLSVSTCYARMSLSWDSVPRATSYHIYASENDSSPVLIGRTDTNDCSFNYNEYKHDENYSFQIAAVAKNPLTGKENESVLSEPIQAKYDSSQYAQKIPILTYHGLCPEGVESKSSLTTPADHFEEEMKYLHDNGYRTLTPDEFYNWYKGIEDFPTKTVMITFDDGGYEVYYLAYPIIKKYNFAATLFCIGNKTLETTNEYDPTSRKNDYVGMDVINKVRSEYPRFSFESHTFDMHKRVDGKKPAAVFTYDQIMEDISKNERFGYSYLAYPWGKYSDPFKEALKDSNYKMAFAYRPFYYALRTDDIYAVNRIKIGGRISLNTFADIVQGNAVSKDNPEAPAQ